MRKIAGLLGVSILKTPRETAEAHLLASEPLRRIECVSQREAFGLRPIYRRFSKSAVRSSVERLCPLSVRQKPRYIARTQTLSCSPRACSIAKSHLAARRWDSRPLEPDQFRARPFLV